MTNKEFNIYKALLIKRLTRYTLKSFIEIDDGVIVEGYGPAIINYKKVSSCNATFEYGSGRETYVFGIFKHSSTFFFVNKYTYGKQYFPYDNEQQKKDFYAICSKIFKDKYCHKVNYLQFKGKGKPKKVGRKRKYKNKKKSIDNFNYQDWLFLYWIYGDDVYILSEGQLRNCLKLGRFRNFSGRLNNGKYETNYIFQRRANNVSPFQNLSKTPFATPTMQKRIKKIAGRRIEKAKKELDGRRYIPTKRAVLRVDNPYSYEDMIDFFSEYFKF